MIGFTSFGGSDLLVCHWYHQPPRPIILTYSTGPHKRICLCGPHIWIIPNLQKKHLLQLLVEKVLIDDRCTFKVWYRFPQFPRGVRTLSLLVAPRLQYAKQSRLTPLSPTGHAIFCVSTSFRDMKGPLQNVRIRLAGCSAVVWTNRIPLTM